VISRAAGKFKCTAVSLATGDIGHVLSVVHVVVLTLCIPDFGAFAARRVLVASVVALPGTCVCISCLNTVFSTFLCRYTSLQLNGTG